MKDTIIYIAAVFVIIILVMVVPDLCNNKVSENEIWWESYQIPDGSFVRIIHAHDCDAKKPLIRWNVHCKMLDYYKQKNDVYDYCINDDEAIMLNAISKRNIKHAMERMWDYAEDKQDYEMCRWNNKMWDTTNRIHGLVYSVLGGELVPQIQQTNKREELYDNLINSGKVCEDEIGTLAEFKAAITDEASARQFYRNLAGSGIFGIEEIGSEDDFYSSICSDFQTDNNKIILDYSWEKLYNEKK
ncbi:MAG: hypothetical protein K6F72_00695 [Bacteroidales bacterium]|nr:hypothetical protein [Bacteroidales bacterium]